MIRAVTTKIPPDGRGAASSMSSIPICRERVTSVELGQDEAVCLFGNQTKLFLSRFLGSRVAVGDEITSLLPREMRWAQKSWLPTMPLPARTVFSITRPLDT